jgi:hypothetical protein
MTSNGKITDELRIGKDLEGNGLDLVEVLILAFAWAGWGKLRRILVRTFGVPAEIRTETPPPNTSVEFYP